MTRTLLLAALVAGLTGCRGSTEYGQCVGAFDDKDSTLVYKPSVRNVVLGLVFIETIIVPAVVVIDKTLCPVRHK